ncbi:MAG TPA: sulfite exporter TauE/SafE family protein [Nitrosopumilus sp.]|nr:sulfite exporter TauE/SafE family protein [Thermoproteota archaeon]HJJ23319.1 sulfite exporter TauE/SafE family protein [Nitrosopumilus sp.]
MSSQVLAKKSMVIITFVLFSLIFIGIIFSFTTNYSTDVKDNTTFLSWLMIAYVAGLSMIILPCTLPLVFIIVPMSMGQGYKKGLSMALLFGLGLTITIASYGIAIAVIGKSASLDQVSTLMFLIAGLVAFVFGLSQLKIISLKMPSYSGTPKFIQKRGEYTKSFFMGLLLGNAGVGCPNPLFYWLLIYIAGTGSIEIGASLGVVHGVGRAIPLILMSVLAVIGINATKSLTVKRESIERASGWMLIIIGALLIINGLPEGHEWYEETFIHKGWNDLVEMTPIPSEFGMDEHGHNDVEDFKNFYTVLLTILIASPIFVLSVRRLRKVKT